MILAFLARLLKIKFSLIPRVCNVLLTSFKSFHSRVLFFPKKLAFLVSVNVCLPLKAKEKWFRKLMVCGNILVTAIPLCMLTAHGCVLYFMKSLYIAEICALGFYPSKRVKGVVDGVVLYIVPGLVCCMLYALIGKTLWGMTAMKTRNRQLTGISPTQIFLTTRNA